MDPKHRILQPMRPGGSSSWVMWPLMNPEFVAEAYAAERWFNRAHEIQVISSIEGVRQDNGSKRFEYHLSVTACTWPDFKVMRCNDQTARWAMVQFNFTDYVEDNHVPGGKTRNYWRPIAQNQDPSCHCFETEPKIVEDKGDYIWRHAPPSDDR